MTQVRAVKKLKSFVEESSRWCGEVGQDPVHNFKVQSETEQVEGTTYFGLPINGPTISGMEGTYCTIIHLPHEKTATKEAGQP